MPWNWNVYGEKVGRPAETATKATWQDYDAEYLKGMLLDRTRQHRFRAEDLNGPNLTAEKQVYLQEVAKNYEQEAEACLKQEFKAWLQGTHEENVKARDNREDSYYQNKMSEKDGGPKRRSVEGDPFDLLDNQGDVAYRHTGWQATRWGTKPLTHLEGVRDFLRQDAVEDDNTDRDMNLLAHYGPQNLDEAWMYFKHWVKRRPVTTVCLKKPGLTEIDPANPRMNGTGPSNWIEPVLQPPPIPVPETSVRFVETPESELQRDRQQRTQWAKEEKAAEARAIAMARADGYSPFVGGTPPTVSRRAVRAPDIEEARAPPTLRDDSDQPLRSVSNFLGESRTPYRTSVNNPPLRSVSNFFRE